MTYTTAPTLSQSTQALLLAALHYRELLDHADDAESLFEEWFSQYATPLGFAFSPAQSVIERLQAILLRLCAPPQSDDFHQSLFHHADAVEMQAFENAVHVSIKAISHRHRFSEALHAEKNQAIYDFAYGLTHEINNPLANIAARAQQLLKSASSDPDRKSLATIVDQAMRAHEMLAEMMRAVKPVALELGTVCIDQLVNRAIEKLDETIKSNEIQLQFHQSSTPLFAESNAEALVEALEGVLRNSIEACRPSDRIDIIVDQLTVSDPDYGPGNVNGTRVRIAIRDTGAGLSTESAKRAFHLYYSGREHGRGLGISLANAKRVIEASNGSIAIHSSENLGTTVEVRLVASRAPLMVRRKIRL